ncbi:MAG TPA: rRNA maturation RNase YbeY [Chloroflexota bacterium]|nr:rRNA maturation RNase YbeY [Chloroflexota bacterium]
MSVDHPAVGSAFQFVIGGAAAEERWANLAERVGIDALRALSAREIAPHRGEVSLLLVDEAEIQVYNRDYRGIDAPTDVLSFSQLEGEGLDVRTLPPGYPVPLGDIVISLPRMRDQARAYGHSQEREFAFLLVHGLLHLLGFDHQTVEDEERMRVTTEALLAEAGLSRDAAGA